MKRLLKRLKLWPQEAHRYYSAEVIEPYSVKGEPIKVNGEQVSVRRNELRQESWVEWLGLKLRRRERVISRAW